MEACNAGADDYVSIANGLDVVRARVRAQLRRKQFGDENRSRDAFARSAAILETIGDAFCAVDHGVALRLRELRARGAAGRARREASPARRSGSAARGSREGHASGELRRAVRERGPVTFEAASPDERWLEVRAFPHGPGSPRTCAT